MPEWITVYCQNVANDITTDKMLQGISDADFYTLAEDYEISAKAVRSAMALLRIEAAEKNQFKVIYQSPELRPILIHRWTQPDRIAEELREVRERLDGASSTLAKPVHTHLAGVKEVIGIELGFSQLKDMGIVIAVEVARWLASMYGGLVEMPDKGWWTVGRYGEYVKIE